MSYQFKTYIDMEFNPNLLLAVFNDIGDSDFVLINGYENKNKGVSNYTVLVGASYQRILESDLKKLKHFNTTEIEKTFSKTLIDVQIEKMKDSISKRLLSEEEKDKLREQGDATIARSDAQSNAYDSTGTAMRVKDADVHIFGYVIAKELIKEDEVQGKYSNTPAAQLRNAIEKGANLTQAKSRTFIVNQAQVIKIGRNEYTKAL